MFFTITKLRITTTEIIVNHLMDISTSTRDSKYVFKEGLVILLCKQQGIIAMRQFPYSPEVSIQNIKLLYEHKKARNQLLSVPLSEALAIAHHC